MRVLVAYATDHGSTRGVADRIAGRLQQRGVDAEARAVAEVLEVSSYEAIVFGSAIHGGKWLPSARQFADRNAASLRERPVWLFSVSTVGDDESMFPDRVANRLRAWRKETPEVAELRRPLRRPPELACNRRLGRSHRGAATHQVRRVSSDWRHDMAKIDGEIVIGRPIDAVFDYVADQSNEPQYNPRMVRGGKDHPGPVTSGTRMRWSGQVRPKGAYKLLGPLISWMGRHQEQRIWASLKRHLEAAPAEAAS